MVSQRLQELISNARQPTVTGGVPLTAPQQPTVTNNTQSQISQAQIPTQNQVTYMVGGKPLTLDSRSAEAQDYASNPKYQTQEQYEASKIAQPYSPTAEDYVQADYNKARETGGKFSSIFGENVMASSAEQELKELARRQQAEKQFMGESQALQAGMNQRQLEATKRESQSAQAASRAAFAQSREGAMSGTAQDVIGRYEGISNERIQTAIDQVNLADMQMKEAQRQLAEAHKGQSRAAILQYQGNVAAAEQAKRQADQQLAQAQSQALSEARQFQASERANIQAFTGILESGVGIDLAGVLNLAGSLGVPQELATSYFAATDQIRKDKTLTSEQKQLELAMAKEDFDDRVNGFQTKEAQKMRDYERLVRQGYNPAELAGLMGIPNDKNPLFQLELRANEAKTRIMEAEANGVLLNPMDRLKYATQLAELAEMYGEGEVLIPAGTKYTITPTGTGISINAVEGEHGGQCGRFVNNVIGQAGFIQNTYQQKLNLINSQVPMAGMIGVQSAPGRSAQYGHVFMVEKVNPDGTMDIIESNFGNNEKIGRRRIAIDQADGFIRPPNATPTTTKGVGGADQATINRVNTLARSSAQGAKLSKQEKEIYNYIQSKRQDPNSDTLELITLSAGGSTLTGPERQGLTDAQTVLNGLQRLEGMFDDTQLGGAFQTMQRTLANKLPYRLKKTQINAQLQALVPKAARGVFGEVGVLTDQDIERYTALFPTLNNTQAQKEAIMDIMYNTLFDNIDGVLRTNASLGADVSGLAGAYSRMQQARERLEQRTSGLQTPSQGQNTWNSFFGTRQTNNNAFDVNALYNDYLN